MKTLTITLLIWAFCPVGSSQTNSLRPDAYGSISGRATDEEGRPLSAHVSVVQVSVTKGDKRLVTQCLTSTDHDGRFQCQVLPQGEYFVLATTLRASPNSLSESYPSSPAPTLTFYPNALTLQGAQSVMVRYGQDTWAGISVRSADMHRVSGHIPVPAAVATFSVAMHSDDLELECPIPVEYHPEDGTFTISGLQDGDFVIKSQWFSDGMTRQGNVRLRVEDGPAEQVSIQERPMAKVTGHLSFVEGEQKWLSGGIVSLTGEYPMESYTATISEDGTFTFPLVGSGRYFIDLGTVTSFYLKSAWLSEQELPEQSLRVAGEGVVAPLKLIVSTGAASLYGIVTGVTENREVVEVVAERLVSGKVYAVAADVQHRFIFKGLAPGTYHLFAWRSSNNVEYLNPKVLGRYANESPAVSLREGEQMMGAEVNVMDHIR